MKKGGVGTMQKKKIRSNKFKVYIRLCKRCDEYCEVPTKRTKYCSPCREILEKERIAKSISVRRQNEFNNNNRELEQSAVVS